MGKVTNKDIPTQFNRIKVPEGYEWEVHNLHAYEEKKKKFAQGLISKAELEQFEISDERSASSVEAMIRAKGFDPVWKDWHSAYSG